VLGVFGLGVQQEEHYFPKNPKLVSL